MGVLRTVMGADGGNSTEVLIQIEAGRVHLEDPAKSGVEITARQPAFLFTDHKTTE